jgi:hypothetical protein
MKKITLLITILLCAATLGWLLRYRIIYQYSVWRMERAIEVNERNKYNEKIQALWDKTGASSFITTYKDTTKPTRVRRAAAMALIKSEPVLAEGLFEKYIDSTNPDVSGLAIRNLGTMKSKSFRDEILQKRKSTNELVRWSVTDYLGNFQDAESTAILKSIRNEDNSEMVRDHAAVQLKHLLKQTWN